MRILNETEIRSLSVMFGVTQCFSQPGKNRMVP